MGQAILSFLEKEEKYIFDKFAKQCSGSVYLQSGNNVVLATVAIDTQEVVEEDFLPLTVQYIEKAYAAGKFPGGYIKREAKPGDFETLSARIVDRSLRPLFPKGYCYPTQITILVLSADQDADLQLLALNAASAALYVSEIPLYSPVSAVRIGKIGDNFVINPSLKQLEESSLDLFVSGVNEDLLMIEMRTFGGIKTQEGQAIFSANELSKNLNEKLKFASRPLVVGHIQRGGSPSAKDRILALRFGQKAVEILSENQSGAVGVKKDEIITCTIKEALCGKRKFDLQLYNLNSMVSHAKK